MELWLRQFKKGFEKTLKDEKEKNMENKIETMSNELCEINNIIALAKADDDIKTVLLNEITKEFAIFYEDMVYEVIELAKHDSSKMTAFMTAILENDNIAELLQNHFYEYFGSLGQMRRH